MIYILICFSAADIFWIGLFTADKFWADWTLQIQTDKH